MCRDIFSLSTFTYISTQRIQQLRETLLIYGAFLHTCGALVGVNMFVTALVQMCESVGMF